MQKKSHLMDLYLNFLSPYQILYFIDSTFLFLIKSDKVILAGDNDFDGKIFPLIYAKPCLFSSVSIFSLNVFFFSSRVFRYPKETSFPVTGFVASLSKISNFCIGSEQLSLYLIICVEPFFPYFH